MARGRRVDGAEYRGGVTVVAVCVVSSLLFVVGVPRLHGRLMHDHAAASRAAFGAVAEVLDEHDVYTTYELRLGHSN